MPILAAQGRIHPGRRFRWRERQRAINSMAPQSKVLMRASAGWPKVCRKDMAIEGTLKNVPSLHRPRDPIVMAPRRRRAAVS